MHDNTRMPTPSTCSRCGASFGCGAQDARCWCQDLPALDLAQLPPHLAGGCFCLACLTELTAQQYAQPHPPGRATAKPD